MVRKAAQSRLDVVNGGINLQNGVVEEVGRQAIERRVQRAGRVPMVSRRA